jgi:hypothetical protein
MSDLKEKKPSVGQLTDEQLDGVQGGNSISVQVRQADATKPKLQNTTGGSIAQGDTLDNTLTENGLP